MKGLIAMLGRIVGIYFAPDNYVIPILRWERYHRVEGPGFFWIIPLVERTLPAVKTSLYVGNFVFEEVPSKDNILFRVQLTVLFTFNPAAALKSAAAQLVQGGNHLLQLIVQDYTNQSLRRLASRFEAEKLCAEETMATIEQALAKSLTAEMRPLGLAPLATGGILIKETVPPEKFKQTMLDVRHSEVILEFLRCYPVPELVQLLNQVIFANSLKDHPGQSALIIGSAEGAPMLSLLGQNHHD
jgi:hypothetical protein